MADLGSIGIKVGSQFTLHTHTVSGVVEDADNNPILHRVRAFNRVSGALVGAAWSDGVTGAYSMPINIAYGNAEVTVIEYDSGNEYNARVLDRITPV